MISFLDKPKKTQLITQSSFSRSKESTTEYYDTDFELSLSESTKITKNTRKFDDAIDLKHLKKRTIGEGTEAQCSIVKINGLSDIWIRFPGDNSAFNELTVKLKKWCESDSDSNKQTELSVGKMSCLILFFK